MYLAAEYTSRTPALTFISAGCWEKMSDVRIYSGFKLTKTSCLRKPLICENLFDRDLFTINFLLQSSWYKIKYIRSSILAYRNLSLNFFRACIVRFSLLSLLLNNFEKIALRKKQDLKLNVLILYLLCVRAYSYELSEGFWNKQLLIVSHRDLSYSNASDTSFWIKIPNS